MTKAIVFDMGGVLLNLDIQRCIGAFKQKAGFADIEDYLDIYHQKGFIGELEEGKIGEEEFYRECLAHCAPGTSRETVHECFVGLLDGLNVPVLEVLRQLRGRFSLYLLTNNNPISHKAFDAMMLEQGLASEEVFTRQFYSYEMKMQKPSLPIFLEATRQIGCLPGEIIFVDDSPNNVRGAQAAGWKTILYIPSTDIIKEIESL